MVDKKGRPRASFFYFLSLTNTMEMHTHLAKTFICALCLQTIAFSALQAEPYLTESGLHIEIGPAIFHTDYKEPGVMEESGIMKGLSGAVTYRGDNALGPVDMLKLEGAAASGKVDYRSPLAGAVNGIEDTITEGRILAGINVTTSGNVALTPFVGFGYRQLKDNGHGRLSSIGNYMLYDRESNYLYTPIGLEISSKTPGSWKFGGTVEYDLFWDGTQYSQLSAASNESYTYSDDLKNKQKKGFGLRASLKAIKKFQPFSLAFETFFRYWNLDNSKSCTILVNGEPRPFVEPENTTSQLGLNVSLLF